MDPRLSRALGRIVPGAATPASANRSGSSRSCDGEKRRVSDTFWGRAAGLGAGFLALVRPRCARPLVRTSSFRPTSSPASLRVCPSRRRKTLTSLAVMLAYRRTEWPLLVLCPASLRYTWPAEIEKFCPWIDAQSIADPTVSRALEVVDDRSSHLLYKCFGGKERRTWSVEMRNRDAPSPVPGECLRKRHRQD